ncbi:hypothetical protein Ciccas_006610 [Cichlidogyrus casuarinus]|uniref:Nibrin n=1 Tax=Cichlidogyrus casuarinus TaxID=1844966 RepID=A0ABD2Q6B7_9PLAT
MQRISLKSGVVTLEIQSNKTLVYLNKRKLGSCSTSITIRDEITFGQSTEIFQLCKKDLHIVTSSLLIDSKSSLNNIFEKLGIVIDTQCSSDTDYLVSGRGTFTPKFSTAMIFGVKIVNPDFFVAYSKAFSVHPFLEPNFEDFPPTSLDPILSQCDLIPNAKRRTLFSGYIFYVFLEPSQTTKDLIEIPGGKLVIISSSNYSPDRMKDLLTKPRSCMLTINNSRNRIDQNYYRSIWDVLMKIKRRPITELELSLALIQASTKQHCNSSVPLDPQIRDKMKQANSQVIDIVTSQSLKRPSEEAETTVVKRMKQNMLFQPKTPVLNTTSLEKSTVLAPGTPSEPTTPSLKSTFAKFAKLQSKVDSDSDVESKELRNRLCSNKENIQKPEKASNKVSLKNTWQKFKALNAAHQESSSSEDEAPPPPSKKFLIEDRITEEVKSPNVSISFIPLVSSSFSLSKAVDQSNEFQGPNFKNFVKVWPINSEESLLPSVSGSTVSAKSANEDKFLEMKRMKIDVSSLVRAKASAVKKLNTL